MQRLYLVYAGQRVLFGGLSHNEPSRFLADLPKHAVKSMTAGGASRSAIPGTPRSTSRFNSLAGRMGGKTAGGAGPRLAGRNPMSGDSIASGSQPPRLPMAQPNNVYSSRAESAAAEDSSAAPAVAQYQPGDRVSHAKFGDGIVIKSTIKGSDEEVDVVFAGVGQKKLSTAFAKLTRQ